MRLMIVGDAHGDLDAWQFWLKQALKHNVTHVLSTGDLINPAEYVSYLDRLQRMFDRTQMRLYFVDGNHDPIPVLRAYSPGSGPLVRLIRSNIEYLDRGAVLDFDGIKFMGFGGAASADKDRQLALEEETGIKSWFPEERITADEISRGIKNVAEYGPIDVMITHEYPKGVDFARHVLRTDFGFCADQRANLRRVVAVAKPKVLYHGHHHHRYNDVFRIDGEEIVVRGLADGSRGNDSFLVFDTDEYREKFGAKVSA